MSSTAFHQVRSNWVTGLLVFLLILYVFAGCITYRMYMEGGGALVLAPVHHLLDVAKEAILEYDARRKSGARVHTAPGFLTY